MRVAVLFDNFGPYHLARLDAASGACDLLAVEFGSRSGEYAWVAKGSETLRHAVVNPNGPGAAMPATAFREKLERILSDFGPAVVVVPGWSNRGGFMAMAWARARRIPIVLMSESTVWDEARVGWKEWIKRRLVGLSSAALVGGTPHADYMRQLGMPGHQVFPGYDAVDNDYFAAEAARWQRLKAEKLTTETEKTRHEPTVSATLNPLSRQSPGATPDQHFIPAKPGGDAGSTLNHSPYFLASNRFIEKKNLFRLLDAYASYIQQSTINNPQSTIWPLCLLGDGELNEKLLAHCEALGLNVAMSAPWEASGNAESSFQLSAFPTPSVYFPGFRQVEELPRFYAHAGAFVHASTTEQWGLVVNEAMAAGLPVIVSNRVGCAQDLVQHDINGFTFDPYDIEQLAQLMFRISSSNFPHSAFGNASRSIIAGWGPNRFALGLKSACEMALGIGPRKAGIPDRLLLEALIHIQ
jgi:1,2-diacylglycerol 3-alpha-glucosyltransferase